MKDSIFQDSFSLLYLIYQDSINIYGRIQVRKCAIYLEGTAVIPLVGAFNMQTAKCDVSNDSI